MEAVLILAQHRTVPGAAWATLDAPPAQKTEQEANQASRTLKTYAALISQLPAKRTAILFYCLHDKWFLK